MRALSIRQPYAEQILRGTKKIEYRSRPTRIRERVYIYASLKPAWPEFEAIGLSPGDLPTGVLVGTVEITNCTGKNGNYKWAFATTEATEAAAPTEEAAPTCLVQPILRKDADPSHAPLPMVHE